MDKFDTSTDKQSLVSDNSLVLWPSFIYISDFSMFHRGWDVLNGDLDTKPLKIWNAGSWFHTKAHIVVLYTKLN